MERFNRRDFVKRYIQIHTKDPIMTATAYAIGGIIVFDATRTNPQISTHESIIAGSALAALRTPLKQIQSTSQIPISRRQFLTNIAIDVTAGACIGISTKSLTQLAKKFE